MRGRSEGGRRSRGRSATFAGLLSVLLAFTAACRFEAQFDVPGPSGRSIDEIDALIDAGAPTCGDADHALGVTYEWRGRGQPDRVHVRFLSGVSVQEASVVPGLLDGPRPRPGLHLVLVDPPAESICYATKVSDPRSVISETVARDGRVQGEIFRPGRGATAGRVPFRPGATLALLEIESKNTMRLLFEAEIPSTGRGVPGMAPIGVLGGDDS